MQTVVKTVGSVLASKILLRILLASLVCVSMDMAWQYTKTADEPTFAGLPTFCPMTFHLLASYSLMAASSAVLFLLVNVLH